MVLHSVYYPYDGLQSAIVTKRKRTRHVLINNMYSYYFVCKNQHPTTHRFNRFLSIFRIKKHTISYINNNNINSNVITVTNFINIHLCYN